MHMLKVQWFYNYTNATASPTVTNRRVHWEEIFYKVVGGVIGLRIAIA